MMRRTIALVIVVAAFFALRLPSLGLLPLYSDEALGMWRAERVLEGSLTRGAGEGKPLHAWMIAAALMLPVDPIVGARAAHVVAGALLLVALWDVGRRCLSPGAGWAAAALWIVLPFPTLFERTVTPDVPLAAAGVAVLACALRVAVPASPGGSRRWLWALCAAGAVATFVKMPIGLLPASLPLLVPWMLVPGARASARARLRPYVVALGSVVTALAAIVGARALLGLRPLGFGVHEFRLKVALVRNAGEAPQAMVQNLRGIGESAWLYLGPVGTALLVVAVAAAWIGRNRLLRTATGFATAWVVLFAVSARFLSAHYLLAAVPYYVLSMAWALVAGGAALERRIRALLSAGRFGARPGFRLQGGALGSSLAVVAGVSGVAATAWPLLLALWSDPAIAPFARAERSQYVTGDWSGYGLPDAARWIGRQLAEDRPGPAFVTLHLADYERLRLYATEDARAAIVQVQVDRYTLPPATRVERARALLDSGRRVDVVVGSGRRFDGRWREAFPGSVRRAVFAKPGGASEVEVWELRAVP